MTDKIQCEEQVRISGRVFPHYKQCTNSASVTEIDGTNHCKLHSVFNKDLKREKNEALWTAQMNSRVIAHSGSMLLKACKDAFKCINCGRTDAGKKILIDVINKVEEGLSNGINQI